MAVHVILSGLFLTGRLPKPFGFALCETELNEVYQT
jgi:hypothetical protein